MAASVVLPVGCAHARFRDSKTLTASQREELRKHLDDIGAAIGIGIVSAQQIDRINILQAALLAMKLAVQNLPGTAPDYLLVDGKFPIPLSLPQEALVKGESKSASIGAASIVAKVERDRIMESLHHQYPAYNFRRHKGYPTVEHRRAILSHGPCPIHRMTFRGVRENVG